MTPGKSLADGNRLQRAYYRWAEPYYARMEPDAREQAILIDRFLYSRRSLGVWLGLLGAVAGTAIGLRHAGLSWAAAIGLGLALWLVIPFVGLIAWLQPDRFSYRRARRLFPRLMLFAALGALAGFVVGHVARHGRLDPELLLNRMQDGLAVLAPAIVIISTAMMALTLGVAQIRRLLTERELHEMRLLRERDAAEREAAQARLRLLQAQIQPHFIFNTLSAVQHWVDVGDPRGAPLLRTLTAFLRSATEALEHDAVPLQDELAMVGHYLQILRARLGDRLRTQLEAEPAAAGVEIPPGLLLTLVENAVEHGIAATLSGGDVAVRARLEGAQLTVEISDSAGRLPATVEEGVGLRNCRERLRQRFGGEASLALTLEEDRTVARVRLPARQPAPGGAGA